MWGLNRNVGSICGSYYNDGGGLALIFLADVSLGGPDERFPGWMRHNPGDPKKGPRLLNLTRQSKNISPHSVLITIKAKTSHYFSLYFLP